MLREAETRWVDGSIQGLLFSSAPVLTPQRPGEETYNSPGPGLKEPESSLQRVGLDHR